MRLTTYLLIVSRLESYNFSPVYTSTACTGTTSVIHLLLPQHFVKLGIYVKADNSATRYKPHGICEGDARYIFGILNVLRNYFIRLG